jgi:hypothetical protein
MRKITISIVLLIVSLGGQTTASQQVRGYEKLTRFKLSAEKNTYYVGEPVELIMTLYNNRNKPLEGDFFLNLHYVWVYHRKVGDEFIRYFPRWLQIFWSVGDSLPVRIPARGKVRGKLRFFYNSSRQQLVLPEVGQYEFKATFNDAVIGEPRPILESNIVRIRAVEPPEPEQAALARLRDPELASFIEGDLRSDLVEVLVKDNEIEAGAEKAAAFLQEHGRSKYAPLVKEQLKFVLKVAASEGKLTPKLKELQASLPDLQ